MAGPRVRSVERDLRHAPRAYPGSRKACGGAGPLEPQLQHAALRLTARGWETLPLAAPDGSGALVAALDLNTHQAVAEHSDGRVKLVALTPDQPAADVTPELLEAMRELGGLVETDP